MSDTHREVELKFRVPADFEIPDLAGVEGIAHVQPQPAFTMSNIYYDTQDLRLFRWGITLRRREGGPDAGWHLKLPVQDAGEGVRDEVREPLGPDVPSSLARLVTPFARRKPLEPVAALSTERTPTLLSDGRGTARVEVVDDRVSVMDGDRPTVSFREIEAEALTAPPDVDLLAQVSEALLAAGAVPGTMGKAGAALGPRAAVPPELPAPDWPTAVAPAGDTVRAYLTLHARRLLLADLLLRRDLPDAVHQMRVSARRLRSGLKVFEPLLDVAWARELRTELGWMASGLGAARDAEVLRERLNDHARRLGYDDARLARSVIDPALDARMVHADAEAMAVVDSERYVSLLETIVEGVRRPPLTKRASVPAEEALPPLVTEAFRRLDRRVRHLDLSTPAAVWHEARIAAKRARYAADAVAPVLGRDMGRRRTGKARPLDDLGRRRTGKARPLDDIGRRRTGKARPLGDLARLAERLADVTEILGHHQDAYVAQEALRLLAPEAEARCAFALGRLLAVEEAAEAADRVAFLDLWPAVRRAARRAGIT